MVDGSTGVELGKLLFDLAPEGSEIDAPRWRPAGSPGPLALAARSALEHGRDLRRRAGKLAGALRDPSGPADALWKFAQAMRGVASGFDPLPFNGAVGSRRAYDTVELPLDEALQAKRAFGVTVNDVALAAVTTALRAWCQHRGLDPDEPRRIKALCPVDNRAADDREMGSNVSAMVVDLPLDEPSARERMLRISESSREAKLNELAEGANMWDRVTSILPAPALRATSVLQFRGLMAQGNLLLSNVRGPSFPFYAFGGRVRAFFPYFGVQDGLGLNVVAFSYDGKLLLGIACDPELFPEREIFVESLRKAFGELASAV
jgi:WS/DGAT/MGAT family acyltransferase